MLFKNEAQGNFFGKVLFVAVKDSVGDRFANRQTYPVLTVIVKTRQPSNTFGHVLY